MTGQAWIVFAESIGAIKTYLTGTTSIMAPFTPLISNIRAILAHYIRKISDHNGSLLTSYARTQKEGQQ